MAWGFRLAGGQDEGISLKLSKVISMSISILTAIFFQVALQSPSGQAGLLPKDLLVAVQGQTVLDRSHDEVVKMIKDSGKELRLTVERGDGLVPNMELLAKPEDRKVKEKEENVYLKVAAEEIEVPNTYRKKVKVFTTAGAPKIETDQYNQPMGLYSAETVARMADTVEIDAKLNGTGENQVVIILSSFKSDFSYRIATSLLNPRPCWT